jgi:membrane protein involved in colicin uptake
MPTVNEILKQSGLNDEQIAALDAKAITAFTGVLTTAEQERKTAQESAAKAQESAAKAEQERQVAQQATEKAEQDRKAAAEAKEAAEVAQRSNAEFYDKEIAPALNNWGTEKANLEAQAAFYRAQNEAARAAGFVPTEAPNYKPQEAQSVTPQRDAQGRYVAGAQGGTPGSPTFTMEAIDQRLGAGISNVGWAMQEYQRLSGGQFLPDSFDKLSEEASNSRLPFRDYVARKYDFAGKQAEIQRKAQEEHDAKVRLEASAPFEAKLKEAEEARQKAIEETDRKWAEKIGSNPDVRIAQPSRFADVARAVKANERPDPLSLNEGQRRQATSQAIRQEISETTAA